MAGRGGARGAGRGGASRGEHALANDRGRGPSGRAVDGQVSTRLQAALASFAHPNWCELPYGWNVNLPAYASFLEPALAAFAMAALAWDGLSPRSTRRLLEFTLLVMLIRRQVIAAFVYMAYSDLPPWSGLAAMGQFTLEALALGLLTGLSWRWARRRVAR